MLVIWGRDNSVNVQKVLWCCEELGLPYDRRNAGMAHGVVETPAYRKLNPNGLIPTIDDDGFVLWESNAVVRYLAAKHSAGGLWPTDLRARGEADRWMDWSTTTFWPTIRPMFMGLIRTPAAERDAKAIEDSRRKTIEILRIIDTYLDGRDYLAGDAFSMGDIVLGACVWRWLALTDKRDDPANVVRWSDRLAQRPAYRKTVMQPLS